MKFPRFTVRSTLLSALFKTRVLCNFVVTCLVLYDIVKYFLFIGSYSRVNTRSQLDELRKNELCLGFIVRPNFIGFYIEKRTLPGEVNTPQLEQKWNCLESEFASGIMEPTSFARIFKISTNHK